MEELPGAGPGTGPYAGPDTGPYAGPDTGPDAGPDAVTALPGGARAERGSRGVAVILGLAAILTAIIGVRATALSGEATDAWHQALRTETKRAAGALVDIRFLYQVELTQAARVLEARELRDACSSAVGSERGASADALELEASVQDGVLDALEPTSELATDPYYALPAGGVDLGKRLADLRATNPDIVALDPDALQASGDALADQALRTTLALVPVGICALFGAIAQPFARRRRLLLALASVALAVGGVVALGVELGG